MRLQLVIIFRGFGILPVTLLIIPALFTLITQNEKYLGYIFSASIMIDAVISWIVGKRLNGKADQIIGVRNGWRRYFDSGLFHAEFNSKAPDHSMLFIRMEYWAIPLAIGAIAVLIYTVRL
jgi:hypothetical protein